MPYLLSCDIHTHTMFSAHAYSTIEENVYWAAERGLQVLGSADHLSSMVTACPNDLRSYQFFINQDIWPRIWSGVLVLRGAEADIVSLDGSLFGEDTPVTLDIAGDSYSRQHSLFDLVTRNLDYLVASVHNPQIAEGATLAQTTEMYINALEHPKVFMLGHTGRSGVPFDIDEVLLAAKAKHKIIEINNHSLEHGVDTLGRMPQDRRALCRAGRGHRRVDRCPHWHGHWQARSRAQDARRDSLPTGFDRDARPRDAAVRDGGSRRVRSAQWDVAEFINQAKGAAQVGRPLSCPKNLLRLVSGVRGPLRFRCGRCEGTCRLA